LLIPEGLGEKERRKEVKLRIFGTGRGDDIQNDSILITDCQVLELPSCGRGLWKSGGRVKPKD
jgi:hypothetical protein